MAVPFFKEYTVHSPHLVLIQASYLELENEQKIIEIGAGSGYNPVVLAKSAGLKAQVFSTEINRRMIPIAIDNIERYSERRQINVYCPLLGLGLREFQPFDRITTTVAATSTEQVEILLDQLSVGGIMYLPMAKYKNTTDADAPILWLPGLDDGSQELIEHNPVKKFFQVAYYKFRKDDESKVSWGVVKTKAIRPILQSH